MAEEASDRSLVLVRKLLDRLEEKLETSDLKGTAADFIRLIQLEQELSREEIREVRVRWIETQN